ncbi:MAG: hypothetical protein COA79_20735 [Planctomycetota bacterium]|nr:MAG: hypothetical protein COA79_20735 [Planctomycetota bacterium]
MINQASQKSTVQKPHKKSSVSQALQSFLKNHVNDINDGDVSFSVVQNEQEKDECLQLAYIEYLKKGYVEKDNYKAMETIYDKTGNSIIFKAEYQQKIIGTVTINWDSALGLPLDNVFPEAKSLFERGVGEIAEVTRLAIAKGPFNSKNIISGLFNSVTLDLIKGSVYKYLVIEVNPRHQFFYKKKMQFKPLIDSRPCQRVSGAPAVLLSLSYSDCLYAYLNCNEDASLNKSLYVNFKMDPRIIKEIQDCKKNATQELIQGDIR